MDILLSISMIFADTFLWVTYNASSMVEGKFWKLFQIMDWASCLYHPLQNTLIQGYVTQFYCLVFFYDPNWNLTKCPWMYLGSKLNITITRYMRLTWKNSSSIGIVTLEYHNILFFRMIQWTKYHLFWWLWKLGFLLVTCNGIF